MDVLIISETHKDNNYIQDDPSACLGNGSLPYIGCYESLDCSCGMLSDWLQIAFDPCQLTFC